MRVFMNRMVGLGRVGMEKSGGVICGICFVVERLLGDRCRGRTAVQRTAHRQHTIDTTPVRIYKYFVFSLLVFKSD